MFMPTYLGNNGHQNGGGVASVAAAVLYFWGLGPYLVFAKRDKNAWLLIPCFEMRLGV